ncbi:hypothetical protein HAX54_026183 [Datura stramonium]|uniref:Uncharacterized protein n=1 Tax=Datura stramonium TaxID=4076 RepID=A0ABS8V2X6_DATST|nr:hypothetical protein [Datura stramonium]
MSPDRLRMARPGPRRVQPSFGTSIIWPRVRNAGGMPMLDECEGCWVYAHADRGREALGATPMLCGCEGRWAHAHAGRVRGMWGGMSMPGSAMAAGRMPMPSVCDGRWAHAHAGCGRETLGACISVNDGIGMGGRVTKG